MATPISTERMDETMGAFYIGVILSGVLFGVVTLQVFAYNRYRSWADTYKTQLLVLAIWFLDAIHQSFVSHAVYRYLISNFLNTAHLMQILWTAMMEVLVTGVIAMIVHGFYITRIYDLSNRNLMVVCPLALGAVAEFACAAAFSIRALHLDTFDDFHRVKTLFTVVNAVFAAVSCALTAVYFVYLQSQPTKFIPRTKAIMPRLMAWVVETGLLTGIIAIASLIAFIAKPTSFIYAPFIFCLGRVYAISFLSTLNATTPMRPKDSNISSDKNVYRPRAERHRMSNLNFGNRGGAGRDVSVHIDTVQYVNRDDFYDGSQDSEKLGPESKGHDLTAAAM